MRIITAIGNPYINEQLKKIEECEVIGKDIQYQEGIIEALEEIKDIDIVVLSNNLPEEYDFNILINKIKMMNEDIEIIVFLKEKNTDIENFLNSKDIYMIYYFNSQNYKLFFSNFNSNFEDFNKEISKEIVELKNYILNNDNKKISKIRKVKETNFRKARKVNVKSNFKKNRSNTQIIVVTGPFGVGKSIVSTILSNLIQSKNKNVLLMDFDIFNNSINTILGICKSFKKSDIFEIDNFIINVKSNFDVFLGSNIIFSEKRNIRYDELKEVFRKLKERYDFILIDTTSNINYKFVKMTFANADKIVFLVEPNLLEIKKANYLLEVYLRDWDISIDKIKIIFNKVSKYKIAEAVLEELFDGFEIIGDIKYDEKYNLLINKNMSKNLDFMNYEKIYECLTKKVSIKKAN